MRGAHESIKTQLGVAREFSGWAARRGGALGGTEHLVECPMCRTHVATQANLRSLVRERLMAVEPPPGLSSASLRRLTTEAIEPTAVNYKPQSPLPIR